MHDTNRTIIVAAGPAERGHDALALGTVLARLRGARLVLVGVYLTPVVAGDGLYESALRAQAARELELLRSAAPDDVDIEARVIGSTSVVRGLHAVAEDMDAETLVIGPSHLTHAGRLLRGDITIDAIHAAPCAVAVAPAGYGDAHARHVLSRIGAAYDGSPEAEQALSAASDLARSAGARLHIVSVLDRPSLYVDPADFDQSAHTSYLRSLADETGKRLEGARRGVGDGLAVTTELADGLAVAELARATADLDLLAMGSRAYGPVKRVLLGSVASGVAERAHCPVLVLPRGAPIDAGSRVAPAQAAVT